MKTVQGAYWLSNGEMHVSNIPAYLFTHIFYAFAILEADHTISLGGNANGFTNILRQKNPSVKTILSIGGDGMNDAFSLMASQRSTRETFINSAISQALSPSYGFSGIDIDWEYPKNDVEMKNYATLLYELRESVDKKNLLLTAAVYRSPTINWLHATYPVKAIASNLDWINLMAYDYYSPTWEPNHVTGVNADLFDPKGIVNTHVMIGKWIAKGLPKTKIVLGMPFYGRAWKLTNPSTDFKIGAVADGVPSKKVARANGIDADTGEISYRNIKKFIQNYQRTTVAVYDRKYVTNYCYSGNTWISYDDVGSIKAKISYSNFIGLLGYYAWEVGSDDDSFTLSKLFNQ